MTEEQKKHKAEYMREYMRRRRTEQPEIEKQSRINSAKNLLERNGYEVTKQQEAE